MIIDLTPEEIAECRRIAKLRDDNKTSHGISSKTYLPGETSFGLNVIGVIGEYCVAKHLGIDIDKNIYMGGDDNIDLKYDRGTLQVKVNTSGDILYFNNLKKVTADILVLVRKRGETLDIVGWIEKEIFMVKKRDYNFGYNDVWGVPAKELKPIETLVELWGQGK